MPHLVRCGTLVADCFAVNTLAQRYYKVGFSRTACCLYEFVRYRADVRVVGYAFGRGNLLSAPCSCATKQRFASTSRENSLSS